MVHHLITDKTTQVTSNARLAGNWLKTFLAYTRGLESPERLRLWAGISAVSGALRRRTWVSLKGRPLYANQYIVLVGEPGVGKSIAALEAVTLMKKAGISVAPDSFTKEKLYEQLEKTYTKTEMVDGKPRITAAVTIAPDEIGVLIKKQDEDFMQVLTKLWDSPQVFEYQTKTQGENRIEGVYINLLGGATPRWIAQNLPVMAFEGGFVARLVFVYSNERVMNDLTDTTMDEDLEAALVHDLQMISQLAGRFSWDSDAWEALTSWYKAGMPPVVDDPRFATYNTRRLAHIAKLTMVVTAARAQTTTITLSDFQLARDIMLANEADMPLATKQSGKNEFVTIMNMAMEFLMVEYRKTGKPVPEFSLRKFLWKDVPPKDMAQVIDVMISTNMLRVIQSPAGRYFSPDPSFKF